MSPEVLPNIAAINSVAPFLKPLVPTVDNAVYTKLSQFEITWLHPTGAVVEDVSKLTQDAEQIKFGKDMLSRYFARLLESPYDERMIKYLEYVTRIHTDIPTKKSKINVDLIRINALLGYVEAVLIGGVKSLNLDRDTE
ncbi:MAG: Protoglobin-domain-containing protein [Benniella sp.]|nr:MAG: Protoglobin-domain-containing protein [Benniella sp.]